MVLPLPTARLHPSLASRSPAVKSTESSRLKRTELGLAVLASAECISRTLGRRRPRQRTALQVTSARLAAAVRVGKQAEARRKQRFQSKEDKKKLRLQEIGTKIQTLKGKQGSRVEAYKKARDQAEGRTRTDGEVNEGEEEGAEEEGYEDEVSSQQRVGYRDLVSRKQEDIEGARPEWAFKRPDKFARAKKDKRPVSDNSRAVVETELNGEGGVATSRQLEEAADEFRTRASWATAAQLYQLCLERINQEQLQRQIELKEAIELEEQAEIKLGACYEAGGRLSLAFDHWDRLRNKFHRPEDQKYCEAEWAKVGLQLAKKLQEAYRWQQSLDVLFLVRDTYQDRVGNNWEEVEIYIALGLQGLKKTEEASAVLMSVQRRTNDPERRAQCSFITDVMNVDTTGERNEEFHKIWEQSVQMPTDGISSVRISKAVNFQNLSPAEREFKQWASSYWEERLKSPAYYSFLMLWVTWPFAIPVLAILRRSGLIE